MLYPTAPRVASNNRAGCNVEVACPARISRDENDRIGVDSTKDNGDLARERWQLPTSRAFAAQASLPARRGHRAAPATPRRGRAATPRTILAPAEQGHPPRGASSPNCLALCL